MTTARRRNIRATIAVHGIKDAAREIVNAALDGLEDAADFGLEKAKENTPREPEHRGPMAVPLAETGRVAMDPVNGKAAVSFSGPYAVYQHELLHLKHEHGGNAKFLENALLDNREEFARLIAERIKAVTEK